MIWLIKQAMYEDINKVGPLSVTWSNLQKRFLLFSSTRMSIKFILKSMYFFMYSVKLRLMFFLFHTNQSK